MSEQELIQRVQEALARQGVEDEVLAAGIFFPRGHTGAMFAGGSAGDGLTDRPGGLASGVGTAGGAIAGGHALDAASGLPERTIVAVTESAVFGFDSERAHGRTPTRLVVALPRAGLTTQVHQRVNVRILELQDASGASVQLEGNRVPTLHTAGVFKALRAP